MPRGIAIDWVAGNVYWTDSGRDVIEVAQMKGENRKTLISGMIDEPHAIAVDPLRGWAQHLGFPSPGPPKASVGDSQLNSWPRLYWHVQPRSGPPAGIAMPTQVLLA